MVRQSTGVARDRLDRLLVRRSDARARGRVHAGRRSDGSAARKETGTIASSWSRSAQLVNGRDELVRRFVEAARRAQIVTIVNLARSEAELGELFTAEICEAFEAEIAFVLATRDGGALRSVVGAYGLTLDNVRICSTKNAYASDW